MFLMSLFALGLAQPASPEGDLAVPPQRWVVDYGRMSCTLARRLGGENSPVIALNAPFGWEPGELLLIDAEAELRRRLGGEIEVRLDDGAPIAVRATRQRRNGRPVIRLSPMPEDFLDRVAAARRLVIAKGGAAVISLELPNPAEAIAELVRCNDDLLQGWGIDVAARRALRRKPRPRSIDWAAEILPSADTFLVVAAEISERGRPLDCRILVSSRNAQLDGAFCRLLRSRARFEPGLDAQGRPVRAQYVTRVRWTVDDPP